MIYSSNGKSPAEPSPGSSAAAGCLGDLRSPEGAAGALREPAWQTESKNKERCSSASPPFPSLCSDPCIFKEDGLFSCSSPLLGRQPVQKGILGQPRGGAARLRGLKRCAWTGPSASPPGKGERAHVSVCAHARVHKHTCAPHAQILHARNLCTQAHPCACANNLLKQVKTTALVSRGGRGVRLHLLVSSA